MIRERRAGMKNTIKCIFYMIFAMAIFLLTPKTVHAYIDTYELNMIEVGDGFLVPDNYQNLKVKNEQGQYAVLPNPAADIYKPVEVPYEKCEYYGLGWSMEMELEGGYKVVKTYMSDITPECETVKVPTYEGALPTTFTKNGFEYYEIYDANGIFVCEYGFNPEITMDEVRYVYHIMIGEEDGDCAFTTYGSLRVTNGEDDKPLFDENLLEKPGAISLKDVEKQIQEVYVSTKMDKQGEEPFQSGLYLQKRTTLKDGEIDKCYMYDCDTPAWLEKEGSKPVIGDGSEESYFREYYDCKDLEIWKLHNPYDKEAYHGTAVLIPDYVEQQIVTVTHPRYSDEAFYAYKLCSTFTAPWGEDWEEKYWYFTKEDYDFLVANNINDSNVIVSEYPEMWVKYSEALYDHDAVIEALNKAMRKHREAISKIVQTDIQEEVSDETSAGSNETAGESANGNMQYRDGYPLYTQKITGDTVQIDGMTPTTCMTWIKDGHYLIQLYDDNWNYVQGTDHEAGDWYNYKYVYFTYLSILDNGRVVFRLAGSDSPVSGNLNYVNREENVETDNGYTGSTDYMQRDDYTGPLDQYEGQEYDVYQSPTVTNGED